MKSTKVFIFATMFCGLVFCETNFAQSRATAKPSAVKAGKKNVNVKKTINKIKKQDNASKSISSDQPQKMKTDFLGISEPLSALAKRKLPPVSKENGQLQENEPMEVLNDTEQPSEKNNNAPQPNIQTQAPTPLAATQGVNFEGLGTGLAGFSMTGAPPDTTMAVGRNHIVQWVNSQYAVFSKTGTLLLGPVNGNTLFSGTGTVCESTNRGDPILQYDRFADRWILSQFAFNLSGSSPAAPYLQCIAISTSNDPTGTYYRYSITFSSTSPSGFNDYGKLGVWPDGYYTAYNMFGGSPAGSNSAAGLCASDRTKMLAGDSTATTLCFIGTYAGGNFGFLPADLDGTQLPTDTTQGGIFMRYSTTGNFRIMKLKPNFTAGTATLTDGFGGATGSFINVSTGAALVRACNNAAGACIAQPGTTNKLDTLGDRSMYRLAYRNRNGTDSLMLTFSVDPDGVGLQNSAVQWFEIRNPLTNAPTMYQNSIYNPTTGADRWMGSIAMNKFGDMLMGYSYSTALSTKPSIAIAGRQNGDPLNTMQAEIIDTTGTGSQTGTLTRWGDYSTMQVDPSDDTTFWYTTEYLSTDGTFNWRTRITSYKFPITVTTATADGNISDGSKFDNGAPNANLDVVIPSGRTITVNTPTTVNSLTLGSGATLIMNADLTVQGDLSLNSKIDTGANTLKLGCLTNISGAGASSYVIGNLQRTFCAVGSYPFPNGTTNGYSPVSVNVTALTNNPSTLTIKANQSPMPDLNPAISLARNWDLTQNGNFTSDLTFNYLPGDVNGNQAAYVVYKKVGSGASVNACAGSSVCAPGTNQISITNVSSFSKWSAGQNQPTAASVPVGGRILTSDGRGIRNAIVTMTDAEGNVRTATSSAFGYYRFADVPAGGTYVFRVWSKRYTFAQSSVIINVTNAVDDLNFTAQ
jgi:hypothetical protein